MKRSHYSATGLLARAALLLIVGGYFFWRIFFSLPYRGTILEMILGILLILFEFAGLFRLLVIMFNYISYRETPEEMEVYTTDRTIYDLLSEKGADHVEIPDVDVLVTTCREPVEVLEQTISACMRLQYPDPEKVHVYLLDDADNPEMEKMAAKYGAGYLTRKEHNGAKAGNLNNALRITHSDLVAVFDADMIPHPDFLIRTVPHFLEEEQGRWSVDNTQMGFLQTPQAFYTEDLYQSTFGVGKTVPNEQDQFYRNLQPCRSAVNAVICCGSNTVILRRALEEVGLFTEETITEDFATGLKIQKAGYRSRAIDRTLAEGATPDSFRALIRQRERWARGTIQTLRQCDLFSSDFSWAQRFNHLASLTCWYYPFERLYLFIAPTLYPLFRLLTVHAGYLQMLAHWVPILILSQVGMVLISGRNRNLSNVRWAFIYEFSLTPFLLIPVFKETIGIRKSRFEVTGASSKEKDWSRRYTIPFLCMLVLVSVSLICTLQILFHTRDLAYLLLLMWQIFNLYFAILLTVFIFRVRHPREHIIGFDKLAHNLNNCYLPVFDLFRILLDPFIKRNKENEDKTVIDYSVLQEFATGKIRRRWFLRRAGRVAVEFGILFVLFLSLASSVRGKAPVIVTEPVVNDLSKRNRDMILSNWKITEGQFLSDFLDRFVTFKDGDMQLHLKRTLIGKISGAEMQTWDFYGYGKYSVTMKPVSMEGTVSSFFTYTGPKDRNPWDEIDIEFLGNDTTAVQFNYFHNGVGDHVYLYHLDYDASKEYHEYGFDWEPDSITWYVDGKAVYSVSSEDGHELPSVPGHIMMNLWAGDTSAPGIREWIGEYTGEEPAAAYYKEFSFMPSTRPVGGED